MCSRSELRAANQPALWLTAHVDDSSACVSMLGFAAFMIDTYTLFISNTVHHKTFYTTFMLWFEQSKIATKVSQSQPSRL